MLDQGGDDSAESCADDDCYGEVYDIAAHDEGLKIFDDTHVCWF